MTKGMEDAEGTTEGLEVEETAGAVEEPCALADGEEGEGELADGEGKGD